MTKKRQSYLTCDHDEDGYTCCCCKCGYNVYTTEEEYLADIAEEAGVSKHDSDYKIDKIEKKLGIKR